MGSIHTWHIEPVFTATLTELAISVGGPAFEADSPLALSLLTSRLGPTSAVTLRTMALAGRVGERAWHVADLAAIHGVTPGVERKALDRLASAGWLLEHDRGQVAVRRMGNLDQPGIDRLHPDLVKLYLPDGRRFPLQPLLERSGAESIAGFARRIGVPRAVIQAAVQRGLNERNADRYAVAAGLHPGEVWPDYFGVAPTPTGGC